MYYPGPGKERGCQMLTMLSLFTNIVGFLIGQQHVCLSIYHRNSKGICHLSFSFLNGDISSVFKCFVVVVADLFVC